MSHRTACARAGVAMLASVVLLGCDSRALGPDGGGGQGGGLPDGGGGQGGGLPDGAAGAPPVDGPPQDLPTDRAEGGVDGGHCGQRSLDARAQITVHLLEGGTLSCSTSPGDAGIFLPPPRTWSGLVTGSEAGSLTLTTCLTDPPDAGTCAPDLLHIDIQAPGLDLTHFPRVAVTVRASFSRLYRCQQALEITTAAQDGGAGGQLLLAVVDGSGLPFADSPYKVAHAPLNCAPTHGCGSFGPPSGDTYAFDFSDASGGGAQRVYMGEPATWTLRGTPYAVQNLRSFETGNCDDYWNWAYTIYVNPSYAAPN